MERWKADEESFHQKLIKKTWKEKHDQVHVKNLKLENKNMVEKVAKCKNEKLEYIKIIMGRVETCFCRKWSFFLQSET